MYFLQFYKLDKHLCKKRFLNYEKLCYLFRLVEFCRNFKIRDEHIYLSFNTSLFLFVIFEKLKKKKKGKFDTVSRFIALLRARVNGIFSIYKYFTHLIHVNISKILISFEHGYFETTLLKLYRTLFVFIIDTGRVGPSCFESKFSMGNS